MLLKRSKSTLLVNISLSPVVCVTLDPLPILCKHFPFLHKSSSKTQVHPSPRRSPSLPLPLARFASRVFFIEFMLITPSYTSLDLLQRLSQYWEAYTRVTNHYYLIDYKLQCAMSHPPSMATHCRKGRRLNHSHPIGTTKPHLQKNPENMECERAYSICRINHLYDYKKHFNGFIGSWHIRYHGGHTILPVTKISSSLQIFFF